MNRLDRLPLRFRDFASHFHSSHFTVSKLLDRRCVERTHNQHLLYIYRMTTPLEQKLGTGLPFQTYNWSPRTRAGNRRTRSPAHAAFRGRQISLHSSRLIPRVLVSRQVRIGNQTCKYRVTPARETLLIRVPHHCPQRMRCVHRVLKQNVLTAVPGHWSLAQQADHCSLRTLLLSKRGHSISIKTRPDQWGCVGLDLTVRVIQASASQMEHVGRHPFTSSPLHVAAWLDQTSASPIKNTQPATPTKGGACTNTEKQ